MRYPSLSYFIIINNISAVRCFYRIDHHHCIFVFYRYHYLFFLAIIIVPVTVVIIIIYCNRPCICINHHHNLLYCFSLSAKYPLGPGIVTPKFVMLCINLIFVAMETDSITQVEVHTWKHSSSTIRANRRASFATTHH